MDIFSNMFSKNKFSLPEESEKYFEYLNSLLLENLKKLIKVLKKDGRKYYELFSFNGEFHNKYKELFLLAYQQNHGSVVNPPNISTHSWDKWKMPQMKNIIELSKEINTDIVYIKPPEKRNPKNAYYELEALNILLDNECSFVILGEEGLFVKKTFILRITSIANLESEEILQDLDDYSKELNLKSEFIVV